MAAKKAKRPPRQVWFVFGAGNVMLPMPYATKREASENAVLVGGRAVGPYVLAERARET